MIVITSMLKTAGCVKPMKMEDGWWGINKTEQLVLHERARQAIPGIQVK